MPSTGGRERLSNAFGAISQGLFGLSERRADRDRADLENMREESRIRLSHDLRLNEIESDANRRDETARWSSDRADERGELANTRADKAAENRRAWEQLGRDADAEWRMAQGHREDISALRTSRLNAMNSYQKQEEQLIERRGTMMDQMEDNYGEGSPQYLQAAERVDAQIQAVRDTRMARNLDYINMMYEGGAQEYKNSTIEQRYAEAGFSAEAVQEAKRRGAEGQLPEAPQPATDRYTPRPETPESITARTSGPGRLPAAPTSLMAVEPEQSQAPVVADPAPTGPGRANRQPRPASEYTPVGETGVGQFAKSMGQQIINPGGLRREPRLSQAAPAVAAPTAPATSAPPGAGQAAGIELQQAVGNLRQFMKNGAMPDQILIELVMNTPVEQLMSQYGLSQVEINFVKASR